MAVAFDAVGPSSSGVGQSTGDTLSWTHTAVAGEVTIFAGVSFDVDAGTPVTSCTCDGLPMTSLGQVLTSLGAGFGFLEVFYIEGQPSGAHAIAASVAGYGTNHDLEGGSVSLSGAGVIGSPYTASAKTVSVASNTSGNTIVGFCAAGSNITASGNTSRFIINQMGAGGGATGNCAGSTAPATGSAVTVSWTTTATTVACMAVEVTPVLEVVTAALPFADDSTAYSTTLVASGGTATGYTWAVTSGSLPGWASLNASTGVIIGTAPGTPGTSGAFTVTVTDSGSNTASRALELDWGIAGGDSAFDSVGPAGGGGQGSATSPLSWTHTTVAASTVLLVGVEADITGGTTISATCDGAAMTAAGLVYPSVGVNTSGGLFLFSKTLTTSGAHSIVVTESAGGLIDLAGGSIAFSAAAGLGTVFTAQAASVAVPSNIAGNMIAGFCAAGANITATTQTARFTDNFMGGAGGNMGNAAGATALATGSSVTMSWTTTASSNSVCCLAVEVLSPAATAPPGTGPWQQPPGRRSPAAWRWAYEPPPQPPAAPSAAAGTASAAGAGAAAGAVTQDAGTLTSAAGAGSVTAAATVIAGSAAAGAGSVTAKAVQIAPATAAAAGAVAAVPVTQAATAGAAGAAAASAKAVQAAVAAAAGAGSVTAAATQIATAAAAGASAVSDVVTQIAPAAAAGAGSVTAAGSVSGASTASVAGAGSVTAVVTQIAPATAAAAATVTTTVTQAATIAAAGTGTAGPAPATQIAPATAAGAAAVADVVTQIAVASAAGAASVTAAGSVTGAGATASAAGAAAVTAVATQIAPATAAGAGSVSDIATQAAKATAAGAGAVTADGRITGTANVAGAGAAAAAAAQAVPAQAAGAAVLSALATQAAIAAITGAGSATAAGAVQVAFTIGALAATDKPGSVLTAAGAASALTASTAAGSTLTATTATTGGPS